MSTYSARLTALREQLAANRLDGFVVPLTDEHMSEYVGAYAQRLAWLTGFQGSAGSAVVLPAEAAIFVDGRYTLQAQDQVDQSIFAIVHITDTPPERWLESNLIAGAKLGYDPWLHTIDGVERLARACSNAGATAAPIESNPIDMIWTARPAPPPACARKCGLRLAPLRAPEHQTDSGGRLGGRTPGTRGR